jgi:ribosomal protein S18 acetylase RimI-like enzyme
MQALDLEVGDRNAAALALYESLGFSVLTRRLAKRLEPDGSAG